MPSSPTRLTLGTTFLLTYWVSNERMAFFWLNALEFCLCAWEFLISLIYGSESLASDNARAMWVVYEMESLRLEPGCTVLGSVFWSHIVFLH